MRLLWRLGLGDLRLGGERRPRFGLGECLRLCSTDDFLGPLDLDLDRSLLLFDGLLEPLDEDDNVKIVFTEEINFPEDI